SWRKLRARYSLTSRQVSKLYVANWPSSRLTTSACSLHKRQKARRTEMICTAMNSLFTTSTLASSAGLGLECIKPPRHAARCPPQDPRTKRRARARAGSSYVILSRKQRNMQEQAGNVHEEFRKAG